MFEDFDHHLRGKSRAGAFYLGGDFLPGFFPDGAVGAADVGEAGFEVPPEQFDEFADADIAEAE